MNSKPIDAAIERWKSALTVAIGVYPIFVGLYAAGFFWNVPREAVGGFSFSDLALKSSILYVSLTGGFLAYISAAASLHSFFVPGFTEAKHDEAFTQISWASLTRKEKIRIGLAGTATWLVVVISLAVEPPIIRVDPYLFALVLGLAFIISLPLFGFADTLKQKVATLLYGLAWSIVAPLALGFNDSQPDERSARVKVSGKSCPILLLGTNNVLAKCEASYVLLGKDKISGPLQWPMKLTDRQRAYPTRKSYRE